MLNNVVSVLILNKLLRVRVQFRQNWRGLLSSAMLQNALNNSASIGMCAERINLTSKSVYNELQSDRLYAFDAFLHDMISILILDAFQYMSIQLSHNFLLLSTRDALQSFLDHSATIHLQGERQNVALHLAGQSGSLLLGAVLEELLNHVIAEHIGH